MADQKISELNTITGANVDDASDKLAIVDASGNETKAITRQELFKSVDGTTFHVDSANNRVGVGTITPSAALDVVGDAEINGNIAVTGTVDGRDIPDYGLDDSPRNAPRFAQIASQALTSDWTRVALEPTGLVDNLTMVGAHEWLVLEIGLDGIAIDMTPDPDPTEGTIDFGDIFIDVLGGRKR